MHNIVRLNSIQMLSSVETLDKHEPENKNSVIVSVCHTCNLTAAAHGPIASINICCMTYDSITRLKQLWYDVIREP